MTDVAMAQEMTMVRLRTTSDFVTAEDYLAGEEIASVRHEYVDGLVYAMAGTTVRHNDIHANILRFLLPAVRRPCRVNFNDVKVECIEHDVTGFFYPDIVISCVPAMDTRIIAAPVMILEILSPTTEKIDRYTKFVYYARIPGFEEYVLVEQDVPRAEVFRRSNQWQREIFVAGESFRLTSIELTVNVDEIYTNIVFPAPEAA